MCGDTHYVVQYSGDFTKQHWKKQTDTMVVNQKAAKLTQCAKHLNFNNNKFWDQANQKVEIQQLFTHVTCHCFSSWNKRKCLHLQKRCAPTRLTCWKNEMNEDLRMRGQQTSPLTIHFNMWTVSSDISIQRRYWQPLPVHLWASVLTQPMMWMMWWVKVDHNTGVYVPCSFQIVVWVLLRPSRTR